MKKENKKTEGKSIWRDHTKVAIFIDRIIYFLISIIFLIPLFMGPHGIELLISILAAIFFLMLFISSLIKNYVSINIDGIFTGNIISGDRINSLFSLKQKNTFLEWKKIKAIRLIDKKISIKFILNYVPFVVITTIDKKEFECELINPKGLVDALKNVGKYHLLSKDSKYK